MYESHYDYIKNRYDNKLRLLFTGDDNLLYETETKIVYKDFSKNKRMFDFSNYFSKSKYCSNSNASVVGKIKDEIEGVAIKQFVSS